MSVFNTHLGVAGVRALLKGRERLHFIGIGGVHMASLARLCKERGFSVSGSDLRECDTVRALRRAGIAVCIGQAAEQVQHCDAVVFTLAVSEDNPAYAAAIQRGVPMISRADLLAYLSADFPNRIAVAGSHGKSTVCAMLASIFTAAERSPTVICGAAMPQYGSALLCGKGQDCITEACEYGDSFLSLAPTTALLLNLDFDHADYFADLAELRDSFARFAALPGRLGNLIYNAEDDALCRAVADSPARHLTFGLSHGDCSAADLRYEMGCGRFRLYIAGECYGEIVLRVAGEHNVKNALAAALTAALSGVPREAITAGLGTFSGVARRLAQRGRLLGAAVIDDYAHHPTEIAASIAAVREMQAAERLIAVFQPHTYSRTAALLSDFCSALRAADRVLVTNIYPARERDTRGMSAELLAAGIGARAIATGDLQSTAAALAREVTAGDTVLVMGAGDVDGIFAHFSAKDFTSF